MGHRPAADRTRYHRLTPFGVVHVVLLAALKLCQGPPHTRIARESGIDDRAGDASQRSDRPPAAGQR